jgi:hypothetical protein
MKDNNYDTVCKFLIGARSFLDMTKDELVEFEADKDLIRQVKACGSKITDLINSVRLDQRSKKYAGIVT